MIIVDVNLLIYAYNAGAPEHDRARRWLEETFSRSEPVGLPWAVVHAFLRLTTDGPFMTRPLSTAEAVRVIDSWFGVPAVGAIEPGPRYWTILRDLLVAAKVRGSLVSDAHIAALAVEHDATLCSADRDFRRFPSVRVVNPLV